MGLTDHQRARDRLLDQLSLVQRWYAEILYVGRDWCRIDAKRAGLRTEVTASRLLPTVAEPDGTLRLTAVDPYSSSPMPYLDILSPPVRQVAGTPVFHWEMDDRAQRAVAKPVPHLIRLLNAREGILEDRPWWVESVVSNVLALPQEPLWREAVYTALLGDWPDPLTDRRELTLQAVSVLRAEARTVHRQLVPIWRRRTRHGRVLSLDADLGDGYCLFDLLAAQAGPQLDLIHSARDQQRIGALLRALTPLERHVVLARAAGEATTWTEAAMVCQLEDPQAFGDRVRRKVLRLIREQERRRQSSGRWPSGREGSV
ncbi:hypothetical protein [Streptomyces xylophagus]|uniref:hypothetical protein n=1 Tax=Streptomyces xylophagus TaxID=285514 RepID=UPI00068C6933|nr:hypothetical protein [Streptomyces xylophagus]